MIIYKATNKINGKSYIGQTVQDFAQYKQKHIRCALQEVDKKRGKSRSFYDAIRKYEPENFSWCILEKCCSREEMSEREIYYIEKLGSYIDGYNMTIGGDGGSGGSYERTPEIRAKISKSLTGRKMSKEFCEKQSKRVKGEGHPLYGIGHKKESIEKMKIAKSGKNNPASKKFKIISPSGEEFIVEGGFNKFCLKNHIWHCGLRDVVYGKKDNHKGWKAILLT